MRTVVIVASMLVVSCLLVSAAWSASGGGFELAWHTIDGGGVMNSTGGGFELSSTIGQPDAGRMSGGGWVLTGGFWFETPPGDVNSDGMVDLSDFATFGGCLAGPGSDADPACTQFDLNGDGQVDLEDFAQFQNNVNGA